MSLILDYAQASMSFITSPKSIGYFNSYDKYEIDF